MKEILVFGVGAESHDPLDAGAVVPTAVEEDDLAARLEVRDVAREAPLAALALARRGKRHDAADPRIEALRDPLDGAALARRVPPLEQNDQLELPVDDPVLQLHQFLLQPQQFLEVEASFDGRPRGVAGGVRQQPVELLVVDLHLQLFAETVDDFAVDAAIDRACEFAVFDRGQGPQVRAANAASGKGRPTLAEACDGFATRAHRRG